MTNDQHGNGREAERLGFGRSIYFHDVTEDNLAEAIRDLLGRPSFSESARKVGSLLMEQETR